MKKIALIADTHSMLEQDVRDHLVHVDEIWHAGDFGRMSMVRELLTLGKVKGVYGNIDTAEVRALFPLNLEFTCEGVSVFMTHIGGYPGRYTKRVRKLLMERRPHLYICGHSHICKVMRDPELDLLHMNPGACGHAGFHKYRTMLKFDCDNGSVTNLNLIELGKRGRLAPSA